MQSKTRAKAKCKGEKGGSKIFEQYQNIVTERTQYPWGEGNMHRRIRRTTSHGSIKAILEQDSKFYRVCGTINKILVLLLHVFVTFDVIITILKRDVFLQVAS